MNHPADCNCFDCDEGAYFKAIQELRDEQSKDKKLEDKRMEREIAAAIDDFTLEDENSITNLLLYCGSGHVTARKCARVIIAAHERNQII